MTTISTKEDLNQNQSTFRPYAHNMVEHDYELSSIIIFKKESGSKNENNSNKNSNINYLSYQKNAIPRIASLLNDVNIAGSELSTSTNEVAILNLNEDSSSDGYYGVFNNFSLMNFSEAREEVVRINLNFGGTWNAFFFGERPRIYSFSGIFLDSKDYPYYQEFMVAYEKYMAGRKCIENGMQFTISYNGKILKGHLLRINTGGSADAITHKTFEFTVLVENDSWYRNNIVNGREVLNGLNNSNRFGQQLLKSAQTTTTVSPQTVSDEIVIAGDTLDFNAG